MTHFYGDNNQLREFSSQPKMKFYGNNNQITKFSIQPRMKYFNDKKVSFLNRIKNKS